MSASPILKWAGGKRGIMKHLDPLFPVKFGRYIDPFMGALAVPFHLKPEEAILSDVNGELVKAHQGVRDDVERVIALLRTYRDDRRVFLKVRARDWRGMEPFEAAARMIYLNRCTFNGLYRVNQSGHFNAAYNGRDRNKRTILFADNLRAASEALQGWDIACRDFRQTLDEAREGDFVFLDPPYHQTYGEYTATGFSDEDQAALAAKAIELAKKGCHVISNNSDTPFVRELYRDFVIHGIEARLNINRNPDGRKGRHVIITPSPFMCDVVAANDCVELEVAA